MNLAEELAAARANVTGPSQDELLDQARWTVLNPDTAASQRPMLLALLREIDLGKRRLAVAIKYASSERACRCWRDAQHDRNMIEEAAVQKRMKDRIKELEKEKS